MLPPSSFIVLLSIFRSVIHLELIFCIVVYVSRQLFSTWLSNWSTSSYWKKYIFLLCTVLSPLSFKWQNVDLFQDFLFCLSICLSWNTNTRLVILITVTLSYVLLFGILSSHDSSFTDLFWLSSNMYFSSEIWSTLV